MKFNALILTRCAIVTIHPSPLEVVSSFLIGSDWSKEPEGTATLRFLCYSLQSREFALHLNLTRNFVIFNLWITRPYIRESVETQIITSTDLRAVFRYSSTGTYPVLCAYS